MERRNFVQLIFSALAVPRFLLGQQGKSNPPLPAPTPWTSGLNPATPVPATQVADTVATTNRQFFTRVQMAALEKLSDVLVPASGSTPGAIAAEVPAFLDFLIAHSPAKRQAVYKTGLNWLEAEARRKFSLPFAQLTPAKADILLKPWLRTWMSDHPPTEVHADFVNMAHADIRMATVNSKAWSDAPAQRTHERAPVGLYWLPIENIPGGKLPVKNYL